MRKASKGLLITAIIFAAIILAPLTASAGISPTYTNYGYNNPLDSTQTGAGFEDYTPHGGYTTLTHKCKECHAVHLAKGSYRLTQGNSIGEACDYCHDADTGVVTGGITLNENGHGLSASQKLATNVTAPDDTNVVYTVGVGEWGCPSCHAVHGNSATVVQVADRTKSYLLKRNPSKKTGTSDGLVFWNPSLINASGVTTQGMSVWCSTCHNANFGRHDDTATVKSAPMSGSLQQVFGHDSADTSMTTVSGVPQVNPKDATNNGPKCIECHASSGGYFPHSSTGPSLLKTGKDNENVAANKSNLDTVCLSCHNTNSLP